MKFMEKEKIKPLPVVRVYAQYWLRRARRVLKLRKSEYDCFHIDYMHTDNNVDVWFFCETDVIAWAIFNHNGHKISVGDKRGKK